MRLPRFSRDWRIYAGGGALASLVAWLHLREVASFPPAASSDPAAVPGAPVRWVELVGPVVSLSTGDRLRACVNVPGVVPNSFVASQIAKQAPDYDFRSVTVREGAPAGWPKSTGGGDCDLFVDAVYVGPNRQAARPARITGAWRLTRA